MVDRVIRLIRLKTFVLKDAELAGYNKLNKCLLWTETVTDCCYVNRQINVSLLSTKYQSAIDQF